LAEDLPSNAPPAYVSAHVDAGRELEMLRPRVPTLRVVITGVAATGAHVTLNGAPLGDETKELDPGSYTVEATARGGATVTRTIALAEGSHETLTLDLRPGNGVQASSDRGRGWAVPGGVVLGMGAIGVGIAAATGALSLAKVSDLKSKCDPTTK